MHVSKKYFVIRTKLYLDVFMRNQPMGTKRHIDILLDKLRYVNVFMDSLIEFLCTLHLKT